MTIIQWCAGISVVLLWGCYSKLTELVSNLEIINRCACDIRLETEGLSSRIGQLDDALEKLNDQVQDIAGVAKDYDFEILAPLARHRREIETDREIFG
jgi:hypothetical protein